tara:strand:- start:442 stop:591 length:150 start_codon:yes stop_codon:yes gene_type:complete
MKDLEYARAANIGLAKAVVSVVVLVMVIKSFSISLLGRTKNAQLESGQG